MATTAFAAVLTGLNSVILERLSDCEVTLANGSVVGAIFDAPYALGDVGQIGMASSAPALVLRTEALAGDATGTSVTIGTDQYSVVLQENDGTGISRLQLERVT